MSTLPALIIVFVILIAILFQGMPVAFVFALTGFLGLILIKGFDTGLFILGSAPFVWMGNGTMLAMPLFVLMGNLTFHSGIGSGLFEAANKWMGRLPGGLAIATIYTCAAFGALCGSSMAGAATMSTIAFPEMEKYKYNRSLSTACIATGGTLSSLIPPSMGFIVYGFLTNTSISKLFIAGILPGILLSTMFAVQMFAQCKFKPELGPPGQVYSWKDRFISLKGTAWALALFIIVIGGLYAGVFTPSEAGAIGSAGALIIGLLKRTLTFSKITTALRESLLTTCFIFTLIFGAMIFNTFLASNSTSALIESWITSLNLSPLAFLIMVLIIFIPGGMIMDIMAVMMITIPVVFPIIINLGFNPVWFGVLVIVVSEMSFISPPFALNIFVIHGTTNVPMGEIFRGVLPFIITIIICLVLLISFPEISLFFPNLMTAK